MLRLAQASSGVSEAQVCTQGRRDVRVLVVSMEGAAGIVDETPALVRGTGWVLVVDHGAAT